MRTVVYLLMRRSSGRQLERLTLGEHGPGHARVLRCDGHHGLPVATPLGQLHGPSAQGIGLRCSRIEHRSRAQHEQAAQIGIACFGDATQPSLAAELYWPGTKPSHAANWRPLANSAALPTIA